MDKTIFFDEVPQNAGSPAGNVNANAYANNFNPGPGYNGDYKTHMAPVSNPPASNVGKTIAKGMEDEKAGKTVCINPGKMKVSPVVGWLVCTEGPCKGKSYELKSKINLIGKDKSNDVVITGDDAISAETARLGYDVKHNKFVFNSADKVTNAIYLNDDIVMSQMDIKAYDIIEMGNSKFLFMPLCGEKFVWTSDEEK